MSVSIVYMFVYTAVMHPDTVHIFVFPHFKYSCLSYLMLSVCIAVHLYCPILFYFLNYFLHIVGLGQTQFQSLCTSCPCSKIDRKVNFDFNRVLVHQEMQSIMTSFL